MVKSRFFFAFIALGTFSSCFVRAMEFEQIITFKKPTTPKAVQKLTAHWEENNGTKISLATSGNILTAQSDDSSALLALGKIVPFFEKSTFSLETFTQQIAAVNSTAQ